MTLNGNIFAARTDIDAFVVQHPDFRHSPEVIYTKIMNERRKQQMVVMKRLEELTDY